MTPIEQAAQALRELRDIARVVHSLGATTGNQWTRLACATLRADAALASLEAAKQEPLTGWKLVPVEPTEKMLHAAKSTPGMRAIESAAVIHQLRGNPINVEDWHNRSPLQQAWSAMLAAAPSPGSGT